MTRRGRHAETVARLQSRLLEWLMNADEVDQIAPRWQREG
jgi:hypothetical protein